MTSERERAALQKAAYDVINESERQMEEKTLAGASPRQELVAAGSLILRAIAHIDLQETQS